MSFLPFTVLCKTCKVKIVVRIPEWTGKAIACPKCKGVMRLLPENMPPENFSIIFPEQSSDFASAVEQLLADQNLVQPPVQHSDPGEQAQIVQPQAVKQQEKVTPASASLGLGQLVIPEQEDQADKFKRPPVSSLERKTRKFILIVVLLLFLVAGIGYLVLTLLGPQTVYNSIPNSTQPSIPVTGQIPTTFDDPSEPDVLQEMGTEDVQDGNDLDETGGVTESTVVQDETTDSNSDEPVEDDEFEPDQQPVYLTEESVEPVFVPQPIRERMSVDVLNRLQLPILGLQVEQTPFVEVIRMMSDFSGIPITLDLDGMRGTGFSFRTPVSFHLENTTVDDVLETLLGLLQLGYEVDDEQILIYCSEGQQTAQQTTLKDKLSSFDQTALHEGWKLLSSPITLHYYTPLSLAELFRTIQRFTPLTILVNHRALNQANAPLSELKGILHIENGSLDSWFHQQFHSIEQVDLGYRIIDASTIEITTAEELVRPELLTVETHSYIEKLKEFPDIGGVEHLVQLLKETVNPDTWFIEDLDSGWGTIQIVREPPVLVIKQSQPIQRQIRAWLEPVP